MDFVTLYEFSETKQTLRCDVIEYYEAKPLQLAAVGDWQRVTDNTLIQHSVPVEEIRYGDTGVVYIAIGKRLREMLEMAIRGPYEQRVREAEAAKRFEKEWADALEARIARFRALGVFRRVVLAITGKW